MGWKKAATRERCWVRGARKHVERGYEWVVELFVGMTGCTLAVCLALTVGFLEACGGSTVQTHTAMPRALEGLTVAISPTVVVSGAAATTYSGFGDALVGEIQARLVHDGFNLVTPDRAGTAVRVEIRADLETSQNRFLIVNGKPLESTSARIQVKVFDPNGVLLDAFSASGDPSSDDTAKDVAAELSEHMKGSRRLVAFAKATPAAETAEEPEDATEVPETASARRAIAPSPAVHRARWPDLSPELENQKDGSGDAAVIVAIEHYAELPEVPGALANAEAWVNYLSKTRSVPRGSVRILEDKDARDQQIKYSVNDAVRRVRPGGKLWFVFIGHGAPSHDQQGLLVGYDAYQTAEGLEDRSVKTRDLLRTMAKSQGTPVVVLDACFSGRAENGQVLVRGLMPSAVVKPEAPSGAVVMTAARSDQYAGPLPGADRPAFSYLVLGALRGWADTDKDGKVTATEVDTYVGDTMRVLLAGDRLQTPTLEGDRKDLELAKAAEAEPRAVQEMIVESRARP